MSDNYTIPREISGDFGKEYAFLRAKGLEHIEHLAHKLWTDYNSHDPGITILELLCYTITDLGYRIAMPVEDIIAQPQDNLQQMHRQFLSAIRILPSAPVSADDYRQLLVGIEGVRNCWLTAAERRIVARFKNLAIAGRPELHYGAPDNKIDATEAREFPLGGLNTILLDYDESVLLSTVDENQDQAARQQQIDAKKDEIKQQVLAVYHRYRTLCEDLDAIQEVEPVWVVICSAIEIAPNADPEEVWARIVFNIDQYLAPDIPFYSLAEMQEMGKTTDQIFEGPVFAGTDPYPFATPGNPFSKKGFICREDLVASTLRREVRLSDIMRVIMNSDGVRLVKEIAFGLCECESGNPEQVRQAVAGNRWQLCIAPGRKPVLCADRSVLNFWKGMVPIELKSGEAQARLQRLRTERNRRMQARLTEDLPLPEGRYRPIGDYQSFQNDFPETYGIGQGGLPETASPRRKVQAQQLKAYLLFFEQVLANYFAQLANVRLLLAADAIRAKTYFAGVVQGLAAASDIFPAAANWQEEIEQLLQEAGLDPYASRKNMFLDHLLARFAEQFSEYAFLMYRLYGQEAERRVIRHKVEYLKDYENLSTFRASGFDYYNPLSEQQRLTNVPGMVKRISRLLGFNHYRQQPLVGLDYQVFASGMVTIESNGVATPVPGYGWRISRHGAEVLASVHPPFVKQVDAYEALGLASLLGCERDAYRSVLSSDQTMVGLQLVDSRGRALANHPHLYPVAVDELPNGPFAQLETAIAELSRYLTEDFRMEGMHLVENLLLRPDHAPPPNPHAPFLPVCIAADGTFCPPLDPYSFRVTVVLPGYSMRLRNRHFRQFVERLIRMETPAHVLPLICFVSEAQMEEFETAHTAWLAQMKEKFSNDADKRQTYTQALQQLVDVLGRLFTVHEGGHLTDCDDDTPEQNPFVLGSSTLGSLESDSQPDEHSSSLPTP